MIQTFVLNTNDGFSYFAIANNEKFIEDDYRKFELLYYWVKPSGTIEQLEVFSKETDKL